MLKYSNCLRIVLTTKRRSQRAQRVKHLTLFGKMKLCISIYINTYQSQTFTTTTKCQNGNSKPFLLSTLSHFSTLSLHTHAHSHSTPTPTLTPTPHLISFHPHSHSTLMPTLTPPSLQLSLPLHTHSNSRLSAYSCDEILLIEWHVWLIVWYFLVCKLSFKLYNCGYFTVEQLICLRSMNILFYSFILIFGLANYS